MDRSQARLSNIKLLENWGKLGELAKSNSRGVIRSQDGERRIRTFGGAFAPRRFSKPVHSAALPPLLKAKYWLINKILLFQASLNPNLQKTASLF